MACRSLIGCLFQVIRFRNVWVIRGIHGTLEYKGRLLRQLLPPHLQHRLLSLFTDNIFVAILHEKNPFNRPSPPRIISTPQILRRAVILYLHSIVNIKKKHYSSQQLTHHSLSSTSKATAAHRYPVHSYTKTPFAASSFQSPKLDITRKYTTMAEIHSQDELVALFSRNLSLQNNPYVEQTPSYVEATQAIDDPPSYASSIQSPISYSITQHYTHSAHVAKARSASEPISTTDQQTAEIILARHGVDVATLFPAQIELFKSAELDQQMRLIQLWRILPPSYGGHALAPNLCSWQTTNFEQEEAMAKMRYDRKVLEEQQNQAKLQDQYARMDQETGTEQQKSYMTSGYEELARREYEASSQQQQQQQQQPAKDVYSHFGTAVGGQAYNQATDPVYNIIPNSGPEWEQRQQQAMENQYGAFQQGDWAGIKAIPSGYSDDMDML